MKRSRRYQQIKKIASKVGQKGAKGMNFSHAQNQLSEANPGMEFSRDQITRKMSEEPLFSEEALDSVFKITIEDHHAKTMNKAEKAFIEIGAFLTKKEDHIQEIGDYLISERAEPGWLSRPNGDEPPRYNISLETLQGVMDEFNRLDEAQINWHREEAAKAAEIEEKEGLFGNGYMTNEVVYEFDDGWKVVYVPAVDEGPNYKGDNRKSNDRTIEGNLNGLCLGATMGYYQTNDQGKIYSVRDPGNNPKVTIRINNNYLAEAKGKNNLPPGVPGAIHAKEWLSTQNISLSGYSSDYDNFPPTTREDAIRDFGGGRDEAYQKGWVMHWYRAGVPEIDIDVEKKIEDNDILIIHSGLGKKYKELAQPVVRFWADKWTQLDHGDIWADFNPHQIYQLSHESWKVYKKEPWMKDAVEKLMKERREFGFKIGIHKIKEYDDISIKAAKSTLEEEPSAFFRLKLHEEYKDLAEEAAQSLAKKNPEKFFKYGLQETYKHLGEDAAKASAEEDPKTFFAFRLDEVYKDFTEDAINNLVEKNPAYFFEENFHKTYEGLAEGAAASLAENNPDIYLAGHGVAISNMGRDLYARYKDMAALSLAKNMPSLFFNYQYKSIRKHYSQYEEVAIESLIEKNPNSFFEDGIYRQYPNLFEKAAIKLAESDPYNFFVKSYIKRTIKAKLGAEAYVNIGEIAAKNMGTTRDHQRLFFGQPTGLHSRRVVDSEIYLDFPDIAKEIAEQIAENDYEWFVYLELYKINDYKEAGREGASQYIKEKRDEFFKRGLHRVYPEISKSAAEDLAEEDVYKFFRYGADIVYDKPTEKMVMEIINNKPIKFFEFNLWEYYEFDSLTEWYNTTYNDRYKEEDVEKREIYKRLGIRAAREVIKEDPILFFVNKIQDKIPSDVSRQLSKEAAEALALLVSNLTNRSRAKYILEKIFGLTREAITSYGKALYLAHPDVAEKALINYWNFSDDKDDAINFFTEKIGQDHIYDSISSQEAVYRIYPYLASYDDRVVSLAVDKLSSRNFANAFLLNINSVPFLDEEIGYILYSLLDSEQRERIFKDLPDSILYPLYRRLEQYDLIDNRLFSNNFIKKIPELTAEFDSEIFHDLYGDEDLDSELSEKALKNLMDKNFLKWLDKTKLKQYLLLRLRERASKEIGRLSDTYSVEASDADSYVEEFLDNNYLVLLKEIGKEEIKKLYYDENEARYGEKHVLVSDYIEELLEGALDGLCAGIFVWFLKSKNIYQKDIEDEILNDVTNEYNFNKYYRLGYNYMVETTGVDEFSMSSGERYMHETEGIYEEDDNLYESGYNPFGELFYRQKTREEVEEELGEELEDDPDLINEYGFEDYEFEYEEDEFEDEVFDKFSKLYKYLVSSGFLKEAELFDQLTKVAVLKRLKRTTRGKGKKDRMEWALVSKSNPKKILKWFGPDKPSKKEVAKEERRIHAFG